MTDILVKPQELRQAAEQLRASANKIGSATSNLGLIFYSSFFKLMFSGNRSFAVLKRFTSKVGEIASFDDLVLKFANDLEQAANRFEQADVSDNFLGNDTIVGGFDVKGDVIVSQLDGIPSYLSNHYPGYCTVVAFFRNLYMKGIEISEVDFLKYLDHFKKEYPTGGVPFGVMSDYLKKQGYDFNTKDFMWADMAQDWFKDWVSDKDGGQKYILDQIKNGQPVIVAYRVDLDEPRSSHAGNIIGLNFDENGNIHSVILDDSSGNSQGIHTINWNLFVQQWMLAGGEAVA